MKILQEKFLVLALYVSYIILITNDLIDCLLTTKDQQKSKFNMTNMNVLTYIRGIQIIINKKLGKNHIC